MIIDDGGVGSIEKPELIVDEDMTQLTMRVDLAFTLVGAHPGPLSEKQFQALETALMAAVLTMQGVDLAA